MPTIDSLGYPLAYRTRYSPSGNETPASAAVRSEIRALEGMQKEALVYHGPTRTAWRMVSDEGPYLNGTDLAPFPLAFYAAGMAFSFVSEVFHHARMRAITVRQVELTQDNFYTMQGSAIRGDMMGGALPSRLAIRLDSDASPGAIEAVVQSAVKSCPAQAYMRDVLHNTFSLSHNGELAAVARVNASTKVRADPANRFAQSPPTEAAPREDIITRLEAAQVVAKVEGGAGSSLTSQQKRTLHVHSQTTTRDDGLLEACVQLIKPIGSTFRFLCDTKGVQAPAPLAYLSAGVGFCFMTQAGRYATIVKQDLQAYRIVQDNAFIVEDGQARALPVNTHLFVEMGAPVEAAQKLLSMSEQTCFLHAAMRTACPSEVTVRLNERDWQRV